MNMSKPNNLAVLYPGLIRQWDYEKNNGLTPQEVTAGSQKKVYWICEKGHSFDMDIRSRTKGQGCPYCNNRRILPGYNDLATLNKELAAEWNWEKNGNLKPTDVGTGSKNRVWWKCDKGHEWQARVIQRNGGTGCPVCANRIVLNPIMILHHSTRSCCRNGTTTEMRLTRQNVHALAEKGMVELQKRASLEGDCQRPEQGNGMP